MKEIDILGIRISNISYEEILKEIKKAIERKRKFFFTFPNVEFCMLARKNKEFKEILNKAHLRVADGIGLFLAAKILGTPLSQRITGTDFMYLLSEFCAKHKFSLYFFGGKEGVADRAALKLRRRNPSLKVVGVCHGYISDKSILLKDINDKAPNILIVCLGMWKQEKWIVENLGDLNVNVAFGNGGAFDFVSENIKRAPKFIQNIGFEWLYRLIKQPWRIKRQMVLPIFVFLVLHQWCRRKLKTIWSKIP